MLRSVNTTRIVFGIALGLQPPCLGLYIYTCVHNQTALSFVMLFILLPLMGFLSFTFLSICAFTFDGSWLGARRRDALPSDFFDAAPVNTRARIGRLRGALTTWRIMPAGFAIQVRGLGMAIISREEIVSVAPHVYGTIIDHRSTEIRSPIVTSRIIGEMWHSISEPEKREQRGQVHIRP